MSKAFYTSVVKRGSYLYASGYNALGKRIKQKIKYQPVSYHYDNSDQLLNKFGVKSITNRVKDGKQYKDIYGKPVIAIKHDTMDSLYRVSHLGYGRWPYVYIYEKYGNQIDPDYDRIKIGYIDIECVSDDGFPDPTKAEKPINSISIVINNQCISWGIKDFVPNHKHQSYEKCSNEVELLNSFLKRLKKEDLDVLSGWNIEFFDIPYIVNRMTKLGIDYKKLSPWGIVYPRKIFYRNEEVIVYDILGISTLDYLQVYKKFSWGERESYRLEVIAEIELGEKKVDYSEYGNLNALYKENHQKFIEYNIHDCELVKRLEDKLGFLLQIFTIAYDSGVLYNDTLGSTLVWDVIIYRYLFERGIVVPDVSRDTPSRTIEGGHVKVPPIGLHKWVVSFDLNSLYPHLIQQYNISPETVVRGHGDIVETMADVSVEALLDKMIDTKALVKNNFTMTPNHQFYKREPEGFLPSLMRTMYDDRVFYKKKMIEKKKEYQKNPSKELKNEIIKYDNMQLAKKTILNSGYGALANRYFRFFSYELAESITMGGQLSIRWVERAINSYLRNLLKTDKDYVIAIDTDSVYISLEDLVNRIYPNEKDQEDIPKIIDFLDKTSKKALQDVIDAAYEDLAEYMNARSQKMIMKRENIANKFLITAKKKYMANVWDSEGIRYTEPKLKVVGIESIKSSTPSACRKFIKKSIDIIMNEDEKALQEYIRTIEDEFPKLPVEEIAFPRGIQLMANKKDSMGNPTKEPWEDINNENNGIYKKSTPIQVKGSLIYNKLLKDKGLDHRYETIKDGEKVKYTYLYTPNPIGESVIAFSTVLPKELGLHKYIDFSKQFEKGYLNPIQSILNTIGWHTEKRVTIEDFFC